MRSRGVFLSAALLSLTVLAALATPSCSSDEPKPPENPPENPPPPPPALDITNPVLSGDYPDPSILRVGDTYWATATSSEWAPHFPLLRSTDLLHWDLVGPVFESEPTWSEGNYWAPELATDNGRYFIFYTAKKKGGPLCVAVATASQVSGPYTDRGPLVCQELGSIDGALIRDENNTLYMVWKEDGNSRGLPTPLWAQPLSEDGTQLIGEKKQILLNDVPWEGQVVEGPYFIKRNGWFYLFYAGAGCCGRACNYGVGVARSKSLLSGWEKDPLNPIVKNNESWKCPGHGSVVTDPEGRDYLLYHAYSTTGSVYVGRQGVLDAIEWGENEWPSINSRRGVGGKVLAKPTAFFDDFTTAALIPGWQWPKSRAPSTTLAGGVLTLAPPAAQAADPLGATLARSTNTGNYTAEAILEVGGLPAEISAGLAASGDPANGLGIALQAGKVALWTRRGNTHAVDASTSREAPGVNGKLHLRMTARSGHLYRFAVSGDGATWTDVGGEVNGDFLPPWDRGVRVALTVGGNTGAAARFDSLRITPE
ncbi:family 43 glycosylhydrolase [Stigmatella sp. ncwal1]|uniref:Family 43 glycosylhydrolase n=1 Tax=Stigmatella ashevillensis TaxID=2995309 RepID=A0ABT5D229_9BACT|nr:family 43 glycosylhydrolase [Stigmatella ashevillena]MDC0707707.1 family 43 glycosylhydrolase [Stigmatella ashevillena]